MRNRLLASLIVCVALLTQLGASLWGATAAREGYVGCHRQIAPYAIAGAPVSDAGAPVGAPAHDHASCFLCQLGLSAVDSDAPTLPARLLTPIWRFALSKPDASPRLHALNRNAPARAPPFPT
jgi:hypothetical protein